MACWVVGGNAGLGDVLWLLNTAKHEKDIHFVGIPRTVELVETIQGFTTLDVTNITTIENPESWINAPGIPEYRVWVSKWYSPHPNEKEYFFDYPQHGSFGSFPLKYPRVPEDYIVAQLHSHRQPDHGWMNTVNALTECGKTVFTVVMNDDEPCVGKPFRGSICCIAELILGAKLFVGIASGITGLAVSLGVPTLMTAATQEEMLCIPPHMQYIVKPSKEEILKLIEEKV